MNDWVNYNKKTKTFTVSGKQVIFASSYKLLNEKTNNSVTMELVGSNGSEWDPNTIWKYTSSDGNYTLNVLNDDVTKEHADNYLRAKLKNM